jgi:hypothetical protein
MPDNGAGTFTVLNPPFTPNTVISSSETNGNNTDFATGLTNRLTKDGDTDPTANLPMAGFKHTGVTATSGTNAAEYVARDLYNSLRFLPNYVLNPSGEINQRGTTSTTDDTYGGPDRWYTLVQTGAVSVSQGTNGENGTPFYERVTQSQASAQRMGRAQVIESANCRELRGENIVLSARVRLSATANLRYAILEWTGTADAVTTDVVNDWTSTTYTAGNFFNSTTLNVLGVGSVALTADTWADITVLAGTVGSSMNNLIVFFWTEGTAAQNVTLDLAQRKLAQGAVATPFYAPNITTEELACMRYYEKTFSRLTVPAQNAGSEGVLFSSAVGTDNNDLSFMWRFKVEKRGSSTYTTYNPAAANANARNITAGSDLAVSAFYNAATGAVVYTASAAPTSGSQYTLHMTADAEL